MRQQGVYERYAQHGDGRAIQPTDIPISGAAEALPRMKALAAATIAACTEIVDVSEYELQIQHVPADNRCVGGLVWFGFVLVRRFAQTDNRAGHLTT